MEKLKEEWKFLFGIIFEPWSLLLLTITISMLVLSYTQLGAGLSNSNNVLFAVLLALSSGLLGGRFIQQWNDLVRDKTLAKRGHLAIRNLKLLFTNLTNLENKFKSHLHHQNGQKRSQEVVNETLELSMMMLKEEIINSIEDWTDIIPNANIKSHIEFIHDLRSALLISEKELEDLKSELIKTKGKSKKQAQDFQRKVDEKEKVIVQIRQKLLERKQYLDNSILSGISNSILASVTAPNGNSHSYSLISSLNNLADYMNQDSMNSFDLEKSERHFDRKTAKQEG